MSKFVCDLDKPPAPVGIGPIRLTISGPMAERIRALASASRASSPAKWCEEALEFMVLEHRSGKFRPDPLRHNARNGDDWAEE